MPDLLVQLGDLGLFFTDGVPESGNFGTTDFRSFLQL
jgi:hypothetical protein